MGKWKNFLRWDIFYIFAVFYLHLLLSNTQKFQTFLTPCTYAPGNRRLYTLYNSNELNDKLADIFQWIFPQKQVLKLSKNLRNTKANTEESPKPAKTKLFSDQRLEPFVYSHIVFLLGRG